MELGFVGLGKMGAGMAQRLLEDGHKVVAYDPNPGAVAAAEAKGAVAAADLAGLVSLLKPPRLVWLMVPSGPVTGEVIDTLASLLEPGADTIVDGGNSFYKDSLARSRALARKGIGFLDVGTSGGVWGLEQGYCMMIGGEKRGFEAAEPVFRSLAPAGGFAHVGPGGAGHYVKMVHNAIEYVILEGYAEGFEMLSAKSEFGLDLKQIAALWNQGSVIRSWLLELAVSAFREDPGLDGVEPFVEDTGEGRWAALESVEAAVPAPALTLALQQRFRSRQENSFGARFIAAERQQFGGHAVKKRQH